MQYENIKTYAKLHKEENGGTTIINYTGNTSNVDKFNAVNINSNNIETYNLTAKNADITNANILYLMTTEGKITVLSGDEISYKIGSIKDLSSESISTNKLTVKDTATIENLINTNLQSTNIVTDYLTVNKSAHFFELIIDKIRSVQGTQINTAANCVVDFVQAYSSTGQPVPANANNVAYYRLFWKNVDDEGRAVSNDWLPLDQALCESFNVQTGTSYDTSNKYYWRKVIRTDGGTPKYVNFDTNVIMNTQPSDYEIIFPDGFCFYVVDPSTHDSSVIFEDFNITSQINGEWDGSTNTWTCSTTQFGLQLTYFQEGVDSSADQSYFICTPFKFRTNIYTKLNIGIYYSDGSYDFFKADTYKKNYDITPAEGKMIEAIIINSAVIDKYDACNWIDLSNSDMDATVSGKSAIPSKGDNVCQLGYRYTELQNPTQDDINRASAIIIAAYNTPDSSVTPPSYAQYQNITNYNLGSHRQSYFDATGAYFVGNFAVQAAGTTMPLDQYIQSQTTQQAAEIIVKDSNAEVNLCVMQVDGNDQIHDLNNLPGMIDALGRRHLYIAIYTEQSYSPIGVNCDLFGRTVVLLDIDPNTGTPRLLPTPDSSNGIYVYSVTYGNNMLDVAFDFRGSNQTIDNGSAINFYGQVVIGGTTYYPSKSIQIASVSSVQGTDAELYKLYKDTELALVKQDKSLDVRLRYGVEHIVGTTGTIITPTNQRLRIRRYNFAGDILDTTTLVDTDYITTGGKTGLGYWEYTYQLANWYTSQNKPIYFTVELLDPSTNIYDNTIVDIILDSNSLFTVEEGLTQSIQANTTAINNEVNARQTQYTSISQTVNNINSTVASHTSSINRIDSSISEIDQTVDGISLSVTNVQTDLNTLESDIQRTGIDIEQGTITLNAENTVIDGNLNIRNANEGLVIYDNATNTPKIAIQSDTLGNLTSSTFAVNNEYTAINTFTNTTCQFDTISLGTLNAGYTIQITKCDIARFINPAYGLGNINYTLNIIKGSSIVQTYSGAASYDTDYHEYSFSTALYTITQQGQYSLSLTITSNTNLNDVQARAWFYTTVTVSTLVKLAKDGAVFANSQNKFAWFGSDQIRLHWGDNFILLNDNGAFYRTSSRDIYDNHLYEPCEIGSMMKYKYVTGTSHYEAQLYEGMIILRNGISGNPFILTLPQPERCGGKYYFIKNKSGVYGGTYVQVQLTCVNSSSTTPLIMDNNSRGLDASRYLDNDSLMVFCDGEHWIIFSSQF